MTKKHAGRRPKTKTQNRKEYEKGYAVGWKRAYRKSQGMIPITRKAKDKLKSEDYQKGMADGLKAGRKCYGNGKGK